jgi:lipoprotein NlpI
VGVVTTRWFLLALALSLGGCAAHARAQIEAENEAALNSFPNDYQSDVLVARVSQNEDRGA